MNDTSPLGRLRQEVEEKLKALEQRPTDESIHDAVIGGKILAYEDVIRMIDGIEYKENHK